MRSRGTSGVSADREVWRRSQEIDVVPDEAEYLLELAAFADSRLDEDDTARIAARLAHDAMAAEDIAAARTLGGAAMLSADADVIARAGALVGEDRPDAVLIPFPVRHPPVRHWSSAATWSGLAAAMVLAGWVGFDLGSGISRAPVFGRSVDEVSSSEFFDATPLLLRDLTENSQT
ncbi:MAG TPA: hypothetical protein VMI30_11225 [Stellaceae bacterium]|nr:hypothetical protein [Stellaceae bacterium]